MWKTQFDSENKIWKGVECSSLFNKNSSIGQIVLWLLERNPTKIAQISDNNNVKLTNDDLRIKTIRAAQNLNALGYKTNDIFSVIARNGHNLAPIVFASFCMGCPISALDANFTTPEIVNILEITKPKLIFCDVEVYGVVEASLLQLNNDAAIFTFGGIAGSSRLVDDLFSETFNESSYIATSLDCVNHAAMIICSSGTTGPAKGVCISHAVLLTSSNTFIALNENDILLGFSSLYWVSGILMMLLGTIQGATRVITTDLFSPETMLRIVEQRKVTMVFTASYYVALTLKCDKIQSTDLSSLKHYVCGGSKISADMVDEMNKYLPNGKTYVGYGTSELGMFATINFPRPNNKSVGQLISGINAKIIDDLGIKCGIGEIGEVCLRGQYKSLAYFGNKKASDEIIDDEGFLCTGDIGYFDDNGYLHLVDRKKEIFKCYGSQVSPNEIEDILVNHPAIKAICVVDVPDPHGLAPNLPAAVVVKNQNAEITEKEICDIVAGKLSKFKRLAGGVYFVDKMPVTPSGKVKRGEVRKMAHELFVDKNHS